MQAHVAIAHFAIQLRLRHQRSHRIHHHDIDSAGSDQGGSDSSGLFAVIRLRDDQIIHVHAQIAGVTGIERVLGVDESGRPAGLLRLRDDLQRDGSFARGFRPNTSTTLPRGRPPAPNARSREIEPLGITATGSTLREPQRIGAFSELLVHLAQGGVNGALARGYVDRLGLVFHARPAARAGQCLTECMALSGLRMMGNSRPVIRAPRGRETSCKGWHQEGALRMLMNNLDPEVGERPDDLIVYGGTGRAARDWPSFEAIVRSLRSLENDETLLVQSVSRSESSERTKTRRAF